MFNVAKEIIPDDIKLRMIHTELIKFMKI
jgi:hypothetical protein